MRKIYFALVALSMIVFASCVKNDPYEEPSESELRGNLFLNEVNGTGGSSQLDAEKYVELYNKTNADINLKDFSLDYGGTESWRGRDADVVPAHGYKLIKGAKTTYPGMSTGLSSRNANVNVTLLDPDGGIVDYYEKVEDLNGKPLESMDHMRIPDGGKWYFVEISAQSPGTANLTDPAHSAVRGLMPVMEKGLKIEEASASATMPTPNDDVTITAKVTDINTITSVVLKWKKNSVDQPDITMTQNGSLYSAVIPKQPDGTTAVWTVTASNDKGKTVTESGTITWKVIIIDYTKLKLNEVSGVGADSEKFYELINLGSQDISLAGCTLHYNANGANGGTLPTGDGNLTWTGGDTQVIQAGKLFSLIGRNNPGSFTTGLTAARILIITLKDPAGNVIDKCIRAEDTGIYDFIDKSFSRIPDGTGPFYFTTPTPSATNGTTTTGLVLVPVEQVPHIDYTKLVLNEVSGNNKYVEIYNSGNEAIPLVGVKLQRNDGPTSGGSEWTGTESDVIAAKAYGLFLFNSYTPATLNTNPALLGTVGSGISSGQILKVAIVDPSGNPVSVFIRGDVPLPAWQTTTNVTQNTTDTYSRMADGTWAYAASTPGAVNGAKTSEIVTPGYLTAQP